MLAGLEYGLHLSLELMTFDMYLNVAECPPESKS